MATVKLHVRKGDTVKVLSGKDRGTFSEVIRCMPKDGRVVVKGVAMMKKSVRPTRPTLVVASSPRRPPFRPVASSSSARSATRPRASAMPSTMRARRSACARSAARSSSSCAIRM